MWSADVARGAQLARAALFGGWRDILDVVVLARTVKPSHRRCKCAAETAEADCGVHAVGDTTSGVMARRLAGFPRAVVQLTVYRLFSSKEIRCNFRKAADPRLISEVRLHHAEIHRKARQRTRGGRVFALVALHQRKVPTLKRFMRSARH